MPNSSIRDRSSNHSVGAEPAESSVPSLNYSIARNSVRVGRESAPLDPEVHVGKAPPRLRGSSRVGHDQITAFTCKVESFIARFEPTALATFSKWVTIVFVGLRLGMGPGHRSSFSSSPFCQIKRHSPLCKIWMHIQAQREMHAHNLG